MKISIEVENRIINNKEVSCYIPTINGVSVMNNGYIIKESINSEGKKTDNLELAKSILQNKIEEINRFINSNGRLFGESFEVLVKNGEALKSFQSNNWWDSKNEMWAHPSHKPRK